MTKPDAAVAGKPFAFAIRPARAHLLAHAQDLIAINRRRRLAVSKDCRYAAHFEQGAGSRERGAGSGERRAKRYRVTPQGANCFTLAKYHSSCPRRSREQGA